MQQKRKGSINWGSAIGWLIFVLVVVGAPLFRQLRSLLSGVVTLPANTVSYLIGGLVALSILISVVRSIAQQAARRNDTQLPTGAPMRPNAPMPPFGGRDAPRLPPASPMLNPRTQLGLPSEPRVPSTPRFEPIVSPKLLFAGLVVVLLLGVAAALLWGLTLP